MKRRWMIVGITSMALIAAGVVVRAVHNHRQLMNGRQHIGSKPSGRMRNRSGRSARCITTAEACPRIMSKLYVGTANLPNRETKMARHSWLTCITRGKDSLRTTPKQRAGAEAAEQGNALAQDALGIIYRRGEGVPSDDAEAVGWYRKSAEQGYPQAQYALGFMYFYGSECAGSGSGRRPVSAKCCSRERGR